MTGTLNGYPAASFPAAGSQRLISKTDEDKGLYRDDGSAWWPVSGHMIKQVNFAADGTTTTIGTKPANTYVKSINIIVSTAFNAATTNTISVGVSGTATKYAGATSVAAVGLVAGANGTSSGTLTNGKGLSTAEETLIATFNQSGTAATAGKALVVVELVPCPPIV